MNKYINKDDFFRLDEQRPSAHWSWHVLAVAVCIIFAIWVWLLNPGDSLSADQINIVTLQMVKEHPDNFSRDLVFSGNAGDFYPYLYRMLIKKATDQFGIAGGHLILQFPLALIYLVVMYFVLYSLTRSVPAALLTALFSCLWRSSMGGSYWGLDRLNAVQPRSFVLVLVPLLLLTGWKYRRSKWSLLVFGTLGLLMNISPPGALFFAVPLWIATLFDEDRLTKKKVQLLLGALAALIIGAGPFIYSHITARTEALAVLSPEEKKLYMEALQFYFSWISAFPEPLRRVASVILDFMPVLLLGAAGWALRGRNRGPFDRWLLMFFLFTMVGFVVIQYIMQEVNAFFKEAPPILDIHRGQRYAYLPLYIYTAVLLRYLFDRLEKYERLILIVLFGVLVTVIPLVDFSEERGDSGEQQWKNNITHFDKLIKGKKIEVIGRNKQLVPVARWARENTPVDSLFIVGRYREFRVYALRSIVSVVKDGGIAFYNGPKKMIEWYRIQKNVEQIKESPNIEDIAKLAKGTSADYIVLPQNVRPAAGWRQVYKDSLWTVYAPVPD
ncbi:MAG: hypothetical protein JW947_11195 [Sedimentisphaerales bacterium]|nr:hypothetical protein [Sedimentisphaerales bacterium]